MAVLKRWSKRLLELPTTQAVISWLGATYVRFAFATTRWEKQGNEAVDTLWAEGKPFVFAFWHSRFLLMPLVWKRGVPIYMLISSHRDGKMAAKVVMRLGISWIPGSSNRDSVAALRTMVKHLRAGHCVGITPDGPRGPRMRASDGVAVVAAMGNVPVVPVAYSTSRAKNLQSWDRFLLSWPFGRGVMVFGKPIPPPSQSGADAREAFRAEIERALTEVLHQADGVFGRPMIQPAPKPDPAP